LMINILYPFRFYKKKVTYHKDPPLNPVSFGFPANLTFLYE